MKHASGRDAKGLKQHRCAEGQKSNFHIISTLSVDKQSRQSAPENSNQCSHLDVPTGTFTELSWQAPFFETWEPTAPCNRLAWQSPSVINVSVQSPVVHFLGFWVVVFYHSYPVLLVMLVLTKAGKMWSMP